jgi:hypothetical protein
MSGLVVPFELASGNWTTNSKSTVSGGEVIVLETDSSLTYGSFNLAWPGVGDGVYGLELLP